MDYKKIDKDDVDINNYKISYEQICWFKDVALATDLPIIVLCHIPLLKELLKGSNGATGSEKILCLLDDFKAGGGEVIAVLSGHMHFKDSVIHNGINYIGIEMGYDKGEIMTVLKKFRKIIFRDLADGTEREFYY